MADVSELAARVRDQMLDALRDISVKVAIIEESTELESTPEPAPNLKVQIEDPVTANEGLPSAPETPSEATSEFSDFTHATHSLRLHGSVSEYATETDDEGNVLVDRH